MKRPPAAILPILLALVLPCSPLACREDDPSHPGHTPPPPASTGAATDPGTGSEDTAAIPVTCGCPSEAEDRDDCPCPDGQACAADYALGDPEPGAFTCRPECIPAGDPLLWCFYVPNAADPMGGCCSGVCRPDGLCGEAEEPTTGGTDATGTDTGTSTGTGTGTSSSTGDASTGSTSTGATDTGSTGAGSSTTAG